MSSRTIYLSRPIGLFMPVVSASMTIDKPRAIETMTAVVCDRSALSNIGVLATAARIAIVLAHEMWRGGALPVVVSLLGWVILIRGLVLLFPPQPATTQLVAWFCFDELFHLYPGFAVALGLYLTVHWFLAPAGGDRV